MNENTKKFLASQAATVEELEIATYNTEFFEIMLTTFKRLIHLNFRYDQKMGYQELDEFFTNFKILPLVERIVFHHSFASETAIYSFIGNSPNLT